MSRRESRRDTTRDPGRVGAGLDGAGLKKALREEKTTFRARGP